MSKSHKIWAVFGQNKQIQQRISNLLEFSGDFPAVCKRAALLSGEKRGRESEALAFEAEKREQAVKFSAFAAEGWG